MSTDRQKALTYLEEIQRDCLKARYGDDFEKRFEADLIKKKATTPKVEDYLAASPTLSEDEKESLKQAIERPESDKEGLTKYEISGSYQILKTIFESVRESALSLNLSVSKEPLIGTALSREYNAFACKVPDSDENLIIFEGELFTLCNLLAKIIIQCLPELEITDNSIKFNSLKEKVKSHIDSNTDVQTKFADLVINGIVRGQPNRTKRYLLDGKYISLHYVLLNSLETFVVGHEFAHIALNHLDNAQLKSYAKKGVKIELLSPDWQMEYDADELGLVILLKGKSMPFLNPFCFLGPELFFTFLDIDERASSLLWDGEEKRSTGTETHPPPHERRSKIRALLHQYLPKDYLESYEVGSELLENIFECLWENFKINRQNYKG